MSAPGPHGTSTVWLGDTQTGLTWKSFAHRWIGAIAWVHGPASQTAVASPTATPTATPPSATPTPSVETAAGATPSPKPAAQPIATPTPYDDTATPQDVLRSFFNAISRHDFRRAYSYLSYTDGRTLRQFKAGYVDTRYDQIVRLIPAPYQYVANYHALTCVGVEHLAHNKNGRTVRTNFVALR